MKATHEGHCQWCGRLQKLPGGVLAKHGYTTKWGFFSGVCMGAEHEPIELSCELVKKSIVWASEQLSNMKATIEKLATDKGPVAWVNEYVRRGRRGAYEWHPVTIEAGDFGGRTMPFFVDAEGREQWSITYSGGTTVEEFVHRLNEIRIYHIKRDVAKVERYIALQTERVANWKPAFARLVWTRDVRVDLTERREQ